MKILVVDDNVDSAESLALLAPLRLERAEPTVNAVPTAAVVPSA